MKDFSKFTKIRIFVHVMEIEKPYKWCIDNINKKSQNWHYDYVVRPNDDGLIGYDYFFEDDNDALLFSLVWK